ncbi:MAG: hypothetical protein K9M80_09015, partial [Candidatus Marinimicrobia bacterium]|nr:hypothetical protein [Candidatus Neomarinimicrobiota bacterium]
VKLEPLLQQIHYKFHGSKNQNTITGQIQYADSVFSGNLSISLGATNLTPIYNVKYIKSILPGLAFKLASSHHFFHYPLSYYAPTQLNKDKFYEDNSSYSLHAAGLNYNSTNISNRFQISYIYSDFQYPFQTSATDSIINYEAAEMPKLYFSDNFHFSLPWKGKLAGRVMVTPQHSDDFFQMQGFVDYRQHLSPIFHTTADLIPNWLGFFKYYFNQLANNMTSYISINSYYIDGGKNLFWYQEFQNMGKIGTNYFTNKRLNINFKVGFKVKTLHLFYAIYNVEGRQFSTMGGMPFHNRLKIFGMEWSFTN